MFGKHFISYNVVSQISVFGRMGKLMGHIMLYNHVSLFLHLVQMIVIERDNLPQALSFLAHSWWIYQECKAFTTL